MVAEVITSLCEHKQTQNHRNDKGSEVPVAWIIADVLSEFCEKLIHLN